MFLLSCRKYGRRVAIPGNLGRNDSGVFQSSEVRLGYLMHFFLLLIARPGPLAPSSRTRSSAPEYYFPSTLRLTVELVLEMADYHV